MKLTSYSKLLVTAGTFLISLSAQAGSFSYDRVGAIFCLGTAPLAGHSTRVELTLTPKNVRITRANDGFGTVEGGGVLYDYTDDKETVIGKLAGRVKFHPETKCEASQSYCGSSLRLGLFDSPALEPAHLLYQLYLRSIDSQLKIATGSLFVVNTSTVSGYPAFERSQRIPLTCSLESRFH